MVLSFPESCLKTKCGNFRANCEISPAYFCKSDKKTAFRQEKQGFSENSRVARVLN